MYTWDPAKSQANRQKHGISFEEARDYIFERKNMLAIGVAYRRGEARHDVIGKYKNKYYVGTFAIRNNQIRIISVRRARRLQHRARHRRPWSRETEACR